VLTGCILCFMFSWATVCKTVRPMLSERCILSCLSVCKIGEGAPPPFGEGKRGPHLTQSRLARGLAPCRRGILIHAAIWPQQIWAENWGLCPFREGELSLPNTMWPGPRPTCMPSFILTRPSPTVWHNTPTSQTDRTDRQTTGR